MSYEKNKGGNQDVDRYKAEITGFLRERGILDDNETVSNTNKPGRGNNDTIDAFRHSYVMGRIAMDYNYAIAIKVGRDHEKIVVNDPAETRMDLHNNAMGAGYGWDLRNKGITSPRELFSRIEQGMEEGKFILYPQQNKPNTGKLRASAEDNFSDTALAGNIDAPYSKQFASFLKEVKGLEGSQALSGLRADNSDLAAALVKAGSDRGFDSKQVANVVPGSQLGEVFASQGPVGGATALVAKVNVADVQPDSAGKVINELSQRAPTVNEPQAISQPSRGPSLA